MHKVQDDNPGKDAARMRRQFEKRYSPFQPDLQSACRMFGKEREAIGVRYGSHL